MIRYNTGGDQHSQPLAPALHNIAEGAAKLAFRGSACEANLARFHQHRGERRAAGGEIRAGCFCLRNLNAHCARLRPLSIALGR